MLFDQVSISNHLLISIFSDPLEENNIQYLNNQEKKGN